MGKNINDSPDAWSFLFEHPTGGFMTPTNKFKNFEHWLYQRDFPGGITVPDEPFILPFDAGGNHNNPERWLDYTVRRTDFASGNNSIYFYLDHNFIVDGDVQMKVEILDNSLTSWHIEYVNKEGAISSTPIINTLNDGLVKTYTFEFSDDISFPKSLDNNMDFRIVNSGSADISVKWVRLIRDVSFTGC